MKKISTVQAYGKEILKEQNSRLTHGECVPVSSAMRLCGILENVCFIASAVVGTFCSRMFRGLSGTQRRKQLDLLSDEKQELMRNRENEAGGGPHISRGYSKLLCLMQCEKQTNRVRLPPAGPHSPTWILTYR